MGQAELWSDALAALRDAARLRQPGDTAAEDEKQAAVVQARRRALLARYRRLMDEFEQAQLAGTRR